MKTLRLSLGQNAPTTGHEVTLWKFWFRGVFLTVASVRGIGYHVTYANNTPSWRDIPDDYQPAYRSKLAEFPAQ